MSGLCGSSVLMTRRLETAKVFSVSVTWKELLKIKQNVDREFVILNRLTEK